MKVSKLKELLETCDPFAEVYVSCIGEKREAKSIVVEKELVNTFIGKNDVVIGE